jgi:hypothetical protein
MLFKTVNRKSRNKQSRSLCQDLDLQNFITYLNVIRTRQRFFFQVISIFAFVTVCLYGCRSSHQTLQLRTDPVTLTIVQRHSKEIPGSDGAVVVKIGDITGGQVLLEILNSDKQTIVDTVSVSPNDIVPFDIDGQRFYLSVKSFRNFLVGEDFAVFEISTKLRNQNSEIEQLLKIIESSGLTFIRNGEEATSSEAAAHLREKWHNTRPKIMTIDGFIEKIASRSSVTNQRYQVKLIDGSVVDVETWLRQQLRSK